MNTRKQNSENKTFRQDAFSSSPEFERGAFANLVANRCQVLRDPKAVSILWWLQQVSWRPGGLTEFSARFLKSHEHLLGTPSMHKLGRRRGAIYSAEQVKQIRSEIAPMSGAGARDKFLLTGEISRREFTTRNALLLAGEGDRENNAATRRPNSYPVDAFLNVCDVGASAFAEQLMRMLLDPSTDPAGGLWNMPRLLDGLDGAREAEATAAKSEIVETTVSRAIFEELDFTLEQGAFVVIEGREGIGKTEGATNWCARHVGRAIYVKVESGGDDMTFYRTIANQIGTPRASRKAQDIRARIEDALQAGQLMLVLDEAHFLWPQGDRSHRSAPKRVDWLRTALVDFNVPVALITTPQTFAAKCEKFRQGGWNSNQIERRVTHTLKLPEELPADDVLAVAKRAFPSLDSATLKRVAAAAFGTAGYLTAVSHLRKRVNFFAQRQPAPERDLVERALSELGIPAQAAKPASTPAQAPVKRPSNDFPSNPRGAPGPALTEPGARSSGLLTVGV